MPSTQVYLILGASGSGRREVLADLIAECRERGDQVVTCLSEREAPSEHDGKLGRLERWAWTNGHAVRIPRPDDGTTLFFITDGTHNPVDQIEAFRAWLKESGIELTRILCVVDCQLACREPGLAAWYDACIHFADVVLLTRRRDVPNKWMSDFQERFRSLHYPCLMEMVKDGRVKNPPMILEPQARRISQAFEEDALILPPGVVFEDETDEEPDEEDGERSPDDDEETPQEDPYFQRRPGGRRVREIPDISDFLPGRKEP